MQRPRDLQERVRAQEGREQHVWRVEHPELAVREERIAAEDQRHPEWQVALVHLLQVPPEQWQIEQIGVALVEDAAEEQVVAKQHKRAERDDQEWGDLLDDAPQHGTPFQSAAILGALGVGAAVIAVPPRAVGSRLPGRSPSRSDGRH
jgi:hypothetical protein